MTDAANVLVTTPVRSSVTSAKVMWDSAFVEGLEGLDSASAQIS